MEIYLIQKATSENDTYTKLSIINNLKVIKHTEEFSKITDYKEILSSNSEKIIAIEPKVLNWSLPKEELKQIKNLRAIITKSAWIDFLDLDYCKSQNIIIKNTPATNSRSVAEYAIWMMFSLVKQYTRQIKEQLITHLDTDHIQTEIEHKTVGIIGLENIGKEIAKMSKGLGMKVQYWSKTSRDKKFKYQTLENLLKTSDIVFNCIEQSNATTGLLNAKLLDNLQAHTMYISVLGGAFWYDVEDALHLIKMVENKKLGGFAIENEHKDKTKFPKDIKGNVFVPAAYGWYTKEALDRTNQKWYESILEVINF